jgi:hypothetical protein
MRISEIKAFRVANMLPAIALAMVTAVPRSCEGAAELKPLLALEAEE